MTEATIPEGAGVVPERQNGVQEARSGPRGGNFRPTSQTGVK
jgi:hypothetical protein